MNDVAMLGGSGYERNKADFYETPAWCTNALLRQWMITPEEGVVWEPAAGDGAITEVVKKHHFMVYETDLIDHSKRGIDQRNFLHTEVCMGAFIITNPPYIHALEFIEHALKLTEADKGGVAMLLRNEYDCAKGRRHLFRDCKAFDRKVVLTKRPQWIKGELKASPRHNFAWYIWDWKSIHEFPTIAWEGD
jgi:hypothetical protein